MGRVQLPVLEELVEPLVLPVAHVAVIVCENVECGVVGILAVVVVVIVLQDVL